MLSGLPKYPLFVAQHKEGLGENLLPQQIRRYFPYCPLSGTFTLDLNLGIGIHGLASLGSLSLEALHLPNCSSP